MTYKFISEINKHIKTSNKKVSIPLESTKKTTNEKDFEFYKNYYVNEVWRKKINSEQIAVVNSFLDHDLVKRAGYSIL